MRRRCWQVDMRPQGQSDGLDRLGQMVRLVIDHAAGHAVPQPHSAVRRACPPQDNAKATPEPKELLR